MADLIVDLQIADAYIDSDMGRFDSDSSMMVIKQSVFKKHGISQADYDSSLVWYAHNMEDYNKAYDKAVTKLKERYDKLNKDGKGDNDQPGEFMAGHTGAPTHDAAPRYSSHEKHLKHLSTDVKSGVAVSSRLTSCLTQISSLVTAISLPTSCCAAATSSR